MNTFWSHAVLRRAQIASLAFIALCVTLYAVPEFTGSRFVVAQKSPSGRVLSTIGRATWGAPDNLGIIAYTYPRTAPLNCPRYSAALFAGRWTFGAVIFPESSCFHFGPIHFYNVRFTAVAFEHAAYVLVALLSLSLLIYGIHHFRHSRHHA